MARGLVILGGSGHAAVVVETARAAGLDVRAVLDDDPTVVGTEVLGISVAGPISEADAWEEIDAVIGIGSNASRSAVSRRVSLPMATLVHPRANVPTDLSLGPGSVVLAGATIQPRSVIGAHVIVNTGSIVDHDCTVGDFVHIAPGAILCGSVAIGDGTFVGAGATIVPGIQIGADVVIGAGAVVLRDVPSSATVVGVPARSFDEQ